jgi:hypothetical protein
MLKMTRRVRTGLVLLPVAVDLPFTAATMAEKSCFKNWDAFILTDAQKQRDGEKSIKVASQ